MEERYIYYNVDGKRYKVPESERSEFEKRAPNAKMSLTYEGKNYSVPLSEINDFVGKIGGTDGITYSSFDENKNYSAKSSTSSFSYLTEPDGNNAVSFEEPAVATNDVVEAKEEKKDTVGNFLQKLGQSYSSGYVKPENYSGVKVSNESTGKVDKVFADAAINSHEEHKKQIDKEIAKIDEEYYANKANEPKKSFWRKVLELPLTAQENAMEYDDAYSLQETKENREKGKDYTDALIAKNISEKVDKKVDQYQDPAKTFVGGVFQGIGDAVFDMDTWDQSIGLEQAARVKQITDKLEKGQSLTKGEQMIVDALVNDLATDALAATFGRGYKAGKVTGESLPFMLETALNPASGLGEAITKKFGKKILGSVLGKAGLYATRLLSDVAGAGIMAATTSAPRVAADAMNRLSGEVDFNIDEDGGLTFNGFVGGEDSALKAYGKAFGSNTIDHFSEMVGNYFGPLGHRAGRWSKKQLAKAADAFGMKKIANNLRTMTPNGFGAAFNDFLEQTQWNGPIGEFAEEMVGGTLNALIIGDQELSKDDLFSKDNLIDTFLGVAIMGGVISGVKTLGYTTPETQYNRAIGDAKRGLEGHVSAEEMGLLEAFANNPFGTDYANLEPFFSKDRKKEDKEAVGRYLAAVAKKQGYEISRNAQLSGTQQGMQEMQKAFQLGQNMTEADLYDVNQAYAEAENDAFIQYIFDVGLEETTAKELRNYSSYDLFRLSQSQDHNLSEDNRRVIRNLAIVKNAKEGLDSKLASMAQASISAHNLISTRSADKNGRITKGMVDGKIVYVKGDVKVENGSIVKPEGAAGYPVTIVDSMTGETMTVNSDEVGSVENLDVNEYNLDMADTINSAFNKRWSEWSETKSTKSKLNDVQKMVGAPIYLDVNGKLVEVEVNQILPNGEVLIKGKKGDLGGQSTIRVDVDSFYDSLARDEMGRPIYANQDNFRSQTANINAAQPSSENYVKKTGAETSQAPVATEVAPTTEPTIEPTEPEIEDFNEMEVDILINGVPVKVEVTNQDDVSGRITYRYTDANGDVKIGGSTIDEFRKAFYDAKNYKSPEPAPQVDTETTATEVAPTVDTTTGTTEVTTGTEPTQEVPITPQAINWDELFEQDQESYFLEMQKQFGDKTERRLKAIITATQKKLDALNNVELETDNDILENDEKREKLEAKIAALNGMVQRLSAPVQTPEVAEEAPEATVETEPVTDVAPETQTTAEEEVTTEEPVAKEEPVVETQPEPASETDVTTEPVAETPAPVAPNPVSNPIAAAKDREAKLLELLNRNAVSDKLKADAAKRAGKEVADMFATYEEYEDYEAEAADLGEFVDFFNEGVKESFENRKNQNNSGNSQGNSVTLEEPKTENNGEQTEQTEAPETAPRQGDNSVGGRTNDGAKEGMDKTSEEGEQVQRESESENDKAEPLAYDYPARKGNATAKKLVNTFGFSNVTIPDSRKDILNTIYDFMMEMSKMLGISPKSIGQGGWLGVDNLRGNSSNSATYQFSNQYDGTVVNPRLKLKYARLSSIAHEWWHSLDHVLSFFETGKGRILTTMSNPYIFTGRKETYNAVKNVIDAIKKSGFESRMDSLKVPRSFKNYLLLYEELSARAFDSYINNKFAEAGITVEGSVYENTPFQPTAEEMAVIAPAFDNLFKVLKEKEGKTAGTSVLYHIGEQMKEGSEAWRLATNAVVKKLIDSGINVVKVSDQQLAEMIEKGDVQFLESPNGTVYGWTDGKNIYLTKAGMNPNTPVHEYTHLWARAMMQKNPKGWNSVKNLLKGTDIWNEVVNDPNYKSIQNDENAVASEALSRVSGAKNAAKLEQMAQKMLDEAKGTMRKAEARGLIQNIKDALNQFWSWVSKNLFEIENFGSVEEVTDRVLWDLMNNTDLGELSEGQVEAQIAGAKGAYNLDIEKEFGEGVAYRMNALELAEQLESEGFDKKQIRTATGWERGYDGKWRYEIDDLVIKDNIKIKKGMTLGDIAEQNELFKAYPFLADIEVRKMTTKEIMETDADGAYIEDDNTIIVRIKNDDGIIGIDEWEVLVHEVQHAIQHYEGFTTGASESFVRRNAREILKEEEKKAKPLYDRMEERRGQIEDEMREEVYAQLPKRMSKRDKETALAEAVDKAKFRDEAFESIRQQWLPYAKRIQTLKILTGNPFYLNRLEDPMVIWDLYKSYAGEVEARNAVDRMYLSPDERAEITFEETEDTPRERQVAIGESAGISEARKESDGLLFRSASIDSEMEAIKSAAIANGTFMKAPNGQPTKLTEDQWLTVRTQNFLNWFGDWINDPENASKVVDENGEPMVVYHGTGNEFYTFRNTSEDNELGSGFYFTDSYNTAERYAKDENLADNQSRIQSRADDIFFDIMGHSQEDLYDNEYVGDYNLAYEQAVYELFSNSHVKGVFLNIRKPYVVSEDKSGVSIYNGADIAHQNNDGIIDDKFSERHDTLSGVQYVAFSPNQIKSADEVTYDDNGNVIPLSERFNPEKSDIRYRKADAQNAAVDYLVGEPRLRAIEHAVNEEASKLGVKVTYKTREQMPEGHENDKGYYNTKTGEIVVCTENSSSIADAIQTILHESVAHKGLRQLMGDKFNEFINRVYNSLDAETKAKVDALAAEHYDGNTAVAMEEYMATLAESENFADNSVWNKIKSIFEDIINAILGRNDIKIGDNELRYILRASYNNMVNPRGMETVRGWAQDQMMREEYKINQDETPEILSRTGVDPTDVAKETAKTVYDRVVNSSWNEFQRQFQDAYQPVRVAIDAIQAETGNIPIDDYENYLLIQNQSSSRSRVEIDTFQRRYYSPIIEQVNKIIDTILEAREFKKGDKAKRAEAYKEVLNYLIAKHGLERNEYYQTHKTRPITAAEMKPELDAAKKEYNEKILAVNENTVFTDAERELAKRDALDEYNAAVTEIKTRQVPDVRDYSGLTSLYGMESTEFEAAEAEARKEVEKFEKMFEGEVVIESLWKKINAATNKTLKHSYESGMISRQQYEDIKSMFNFYIPLRGFSEETAEDVYSYARFEGNRFNPAVYKAQGRTSVADDPIAIIMNMAESEIAQGNKNRAKQALYNYLLNRASGKMGQNSLMNVEDVWYYVSTDENGETVYTIAAPDHANGETYEAFENKMQALAEDGKAEKSKKGKVDIGKRFQKKQNEDSHYVYLKVNGVDKAIYINGDPKAAEAINARNNKQPNWFTDKMRSLNRALSSTFTNYSIGFTARNYFRDLIYARIAVDVKEKGAEYKLKFRKNWYVGNVAVMMKMLSDYRNGKYDNGNLSELQAAFVDFMNNGGQTGYTLINSVENHKAELERAIARMQTGVDKGGIKDIVVIGHLLKGVEFLNEAMELRTRFAAFKTSRDLGRGINTAINDAKEITVNFNTKGAQDGTGVWGGLASYFGWSKYFFNASVQGVQNLTAMAKKSPIKFGTVVCSITALGFMMPIIQAALYEAIGGDDDDYWNIPEYDRQNNLCIMIGGGKYVKMPLPIGFREMYAIGDMVAAMVFDKKFERDVEQIGLDMANKVASVVLPINPLESSANGLNIWASIGNTLAPSSAQFLIQNAMNVDWKGAPLQKEYTYNEDDPQWMKAFNNNPMWMKSLSKWCNENINLDGDYKGMDWSPEKLDNTLSNLGGGIYTVVKQFGQIIATAMDDEKKFSMSNVPFAGAVVGNGIDSDERFVTDAYFDMKDYYDANVNRIKRVAKSFGYEEEDVFMKKKGQHHPKMAEIYSNQNFEFMKEWYKGNEKLEDVKNDIKKLEKEIASKKNPSEGRLRKLDRLNAEFETKRSEFVNKMLELE